MAVKWPWTKLVILTDTWLSTIKEYEKEQTVFHIFCDVLCVPLYRARAVWRPSGTILSGPLLLKWISFGPNGNIFVCKVDIWNINCAWTTALIFDPRTDVLEKMSIFLWQKILLPGGFHSPISGFLSTTLAFELPGPHICYPMLWNTGSGGINILFVKLTLEISAVLGQQHSFSTHESMFLRKCRCLWERKCLDPWGAWIPTWINNHDHYIVWDKITHAILNFNGVTVEVWEWISSSVSHFSRRMITYPCWI